MDNNKYLDEDKYQQTVKKLKKTGKIVLIVGVVLLILSSIFSILGFVGFGSFFSKTLLNPEQAAKGVFHDIEVFALAGMMGTLGFVAVIASTILLVIAHKREIAAFNIQQGMPVTKEAIKEMAPTIGGAVGEIAKEVKKGINEADKDDGE